MVQGRKIETLLERGFFPTLFYYVLIVLSITACTEASSQWSKVADFGSKIISIYFLDSVLDIGFVGVYGTTLVEPKLWYTADNGLSWTLISYPVNSKGNRAHPFSVTFKDKLEGWFAGHFLNAEAVLHTLDGGQTWAEVYSAPITDIQYVPSTGYLLLSQYFRSFVLSADGVNFTSVIRPEMSSSLSITFSDNLHGIITATVPQTNLLYTSDGGLNWNPTVIHSEFYQPVGIPNTTTFFAMSEYSDSPNGSKLFRSDDGGISWSELYTYRNPGNETCTGTLQYGANMALFFQSTETGGTGIMMSEDTGKTFISICGPLNDVDTRFYVRDTFIYAGDKFGGLWLNTTGIGSNSKPILSSDTISFHPLTCSGEERLITFTLFDSCNNRQAKLLNASITGNPVFSITKGAEQRIIHPDDSLVIVYTPDSSSKDTDSGQVHLQFKLGWKTFDTTISLLGLGKIVADSIALIPSLTRNIIASEQVTEYLISPSKAVSGKNLSEVTFDVTLDADLVTPIDFKNYMSRATIDTSSTTLADGFLTYHIRISGNDLLLDPAEAIVRIKLLTYVTDTISTNIALSNIKLNGFDPDYERCTLSASSRDTAFTLALLCGDRTIMDFMRRGRSALEITSIKPNPARDEVTVEIMSELNDAVIIEIYDALGNLVQTQDADRMSALRTLVVSVDKLSSGSYVMRASSGSSVTSRHFVVER
jgi:photosystem II stability/assembly factor-like uncharacterized protein